MGTEAANKNVTAFGCALVAILLGMTACGSGESEPTSDAAAPVRTASDDAPPEDSTAPQASQDAPADDVADPPAEECDTSTIVYTPFTDAIPDTWPASIPVPEDLEEISGDVGVGCARVTVDMRSRYYGAGREWVATYGDQLKAGGLELDDEIDELNQLTRRYRQGDDVITYGGPIELEGRDGEYIGVGIVIVDFDE